MAGIPDRSTNTWDASAQMDATLDELISHPINLNGAFTIRTASGALESVSLCGLPSTATYAKTYSVLKDRPEMKKWWDRYNLQVEFDTEHQERLDRFLGTLSDAQFDVLARVLGGSPEPRHLQYLVICTMLPQDLGTWQRDRVQRQVPKLKSTPPSGLSSSTLESSKWPLPSPPTATSSSKQQAQPRERNRVRICFSIDDVDGAADLLLKIALSMQESDLASNDTILVLLQRFARLSSTISNQLSLKWMSKWPISWQGIDEFTLDLTKAYAPDGVFLPHPRWLQVLNTFRNDEPAVFTVLAPTKEAETEAYKAFGFGRWNSMF